jgi:putative heme transporter
VTSEAASAGTIGRGTVGGSAGPTLSRRTILGRAAVLVAILVVVFGIMLPRLVDYETVRAAVAALTPWQVAALAVTSLLACVANAGPYRILVPGLSRARAVGSDLAARAIVSTVPGPTDVATRFLLYRQWSIPTDAASAGIGLAGLFEALSFFALPLIAFPGLLVLDHPTRSEGMVLVLIGLVVLAAATVLLATLVRSEDLALRIGRWLDTTATRVWTLFRKTPPAGIVEGMLELGERSKALLTRRGLPAFAAAVVGRLAWFVVLEVALWSVGVGPDALPPATVLAAMAVVGMVSLLPITPGAVGVAEVAYIGILSSVAGPGFGGQLTAAVSLFRIAQWLAPIPIGWVLLIVMRRGHWGNLLGGPEPAAASSA